jgi:hypothetical protein
MHMWGGIRRTTNRSRQGVADISIRQIRHPSYKLSHFVRDPTGSVLLLCTDQGFLRYDQVPLSAYIIADMLEVVHAHASYRFIIRDEEDEKIRILVSNKSSFALTELIIAVQVWLFNPSVRISHSVSRAFALPGIGSSHAAKVMFKLVGPTETLPVDR